MILFSFGSIVICCRMCYAGGIIKKCGGGSQMERILEELYMGNLCPAETQEVENPEYEEQNEQLLEAADAFIEKLDPELQETYEELNTLQLEVTQMEKTQCFVDGFRMGMKIVLEALGKRCGENEE